MRNFVFEEISAPLLLKMNTRRHEARLQFFFPLNLSSLSCLENCTSTFALILYRKCVIEHHQKWFFPIKKNWLSTNNIILIRNFPWHDRTLLSNFFTIFVRFMWHKASRNTMNLMFRSIDEQKWFEPSKKWLSFQIFWHTPFYFHWQQHSFTGTILSLKLYNVVHAIFSRD